QLSVPLGFRQDISRGEAVMYTTIDGTAPQPYSIEIEEIRDDDSALRNLVIHVTDPALLDNAGGIVQGMCGSAIVQNGRLVGAVTHVFVRDPTRGYGIFAENMYAQTAALAASAA
ncbi:MAG: SpoIVB peptidase, partial [Oscillospiraceae bacterium]|nr:SpoIVB peptidase [Oscillospiraceae bacterium]